MALPQYGGTNGVPELDIGQAGSTRRGNNTAWSTVRVIENPAEPESVVNPMPQQRANFRDLLSAGQSRVQWACTLKTDGNATRRTIISELRLYASNVVYARETRLTDTAGGIISERAVMLAPVFGQVMKLSGSGNFTQLMELRLMFLCL